MASGRERHTDLQATQSTICERYSEWLHHFFPSLPFHLLRQISKQGYQKTKPLWHVAEPPPAPYLEVPAPTTPPPHVKLTQQKNCAARGRRQEAPDTCLHHQWLDITWTVTKSRPAPGSPETLPQLSRFPSQDFHSCMLFTQYFRRKETSLYHLFLILTLLPSKAEAYYLHQA